LRVPSSSKSKSQSHVASVLELDDADAMAKLRASLSKHFNEGFSPLTNVLKQVDNWTERHKYPTLL
jgi:hypothetical protein